VSKIRRRVCSADLLIGVPVSQYTEVGPDTNEVQLPSSESAVRGNADAAAATVFDPHVDIIRGRNDGSGESSLVYPQVQVSSSWLTYAE
jgi:hypothetical protein